jgi:hypothetical protein
MKGGKAGEGEGKPGADNSDDKKEDADSGGDKGQQKGQRGAPVKKGEKGSGGKGDKSGRSGDKQGQKSGQNKNTQNSGQNQSKGDPRSGKDQAADKDDSKQNQGDDGKSDDERDQKSDEQSSERPSSSSKSSSSALRDVVSKVSPVLKWIVFAIIALAVVFVLLRSGLQFLANFTDWARRLLDALRNFWANLFGGARRTKEEEEQVEVEERKLRERPFASFHNPFDGGRSRMELPELIRYTFAAAQAWARERELGRQPGETPLEFADRVGAEVPALEADLERLALLYARAVYSRGGLPASSVEVLRQFWQKLETVAEQPLSA